MLNHSQAPRPALRAWRRRPGLPLLALLAMLAAAPSAAHASGVPTGVGPGPGTKDALVVALFLGGAVAVVWAVGRTPP